jgi:hypothetical protein
LIHDIGVSDRGHFSHHDPAVDDLDAMLLEAIDELQVKLFELRLIVDLANDRFLHDQSHGIILPSARVGATCLEHHLK